MQILGKVEIQNEEKEIVVKEEDAFFKISRKEIRTRCFNRNT